MIFVLCSLFLTGTRDLNPPDVVELARAGLEFSYVENFDSAQYYFDRIIALHPDNPAGYFFKAALLQLGMMDACSFDREVEYFELLKKTGALAQSILDKEQNNWAQFYLGSSFAYRAVYEGLKKNYLETFNLGVKGGRMLQDLVKKDSTAYDAYLGCGTFEYFWARAARYLPILKLAGGNAEEAIRKLHVAAALSSYSGPTAENSLVFIYGEEKKFDLAEKMIDSLLVRYPESKTFLWNKADLEYKQKDYVAARELYAKLYSLYDAQDRKNFSNLAQCKLYYGKCNYELKDKDAARAALKEVVTFKRYVADYPKINEYCREAYALLGKLLK